MGINGLKKKLQIIINIPFTVSVVTNDRRNRQLPLEKILGGGAQEFWHCHQRQLFFVVWPALLLLSPVASAFDYALHEGLAKDTMPYVNKQWHQLTSNGREERFLSAYKTFYLPPYIVIGFVLRLRETQEIYRVFVFERLDRSSCFNQECPSLMFIEEHIGPN